MLNFLSDPASAAMGLVRRLQLLYVQANVGLSGKIEKHSRAAVFYPVNKITFLKPEQIHCHLACNHLYFRLETKVAQLENRCDPFVLDGLLHQCCCERLEPGDICLDGIGN